MSLSPYEYFIEYLWYPYTPLMYLVRGKKFLVSLYISVKRAVSTGSVGVHACMWLSLSTSVLSFSLGKDSTVSLLPTLGGWARRARWWCRVQHTEAWMQRMLTFASVDCCRDRKNLLFHMLVLVTTLPYTLYFPTLPSSVRLPLPPSSLNQMAPWTLFTLGGCPRCSVCPSASPLPPFVFFIPLHSSLNASDGF